MSFGRGSGGGFGRGDSERSPTSKIGRSSHRQCVTIICYVLYYPPPSSPPFAPRPPPSLCLPAAPSGSAPGLASLRSPRPLDMT